MSAEVLPDHAAFINTQLGGFNKAMGLRFVKATADELVAELVVGDNHRQPFGIVHGGVYASIIETMCSTGAAITAMPRGQSVVGLENTTSFLRAVRKGTLRGVATPLTRGRRSQVWEGRIYDDDGRLAATGRVRLLCLDAGAEIAGERVQIKASE